MKIKYSNIFYILISKLLGRPWFSFKFSVLISIYEFFGENLIFGGNNQTNWAVIYIGTVYPISLHLADMLPCIVSFVD